MRYHCAMSGQSQTPPERSSVLRVIGEFLRLVVIAAAIAIPFRYFIAQPFIVRGASMEPNFYNGEYLVINELAYFFRNPERGEVIVFHNPEDPKEYFIKRVIGLPGEIVEVKPDRVVIINPEHPDGLELPETYLPAQRPKGVGLGGEFRFTLGESEYVVLGDNRSFSKDSRSWGKLEKKFITGYALFRAWPPYAFGIITPP